MATHTQLPIYKVAYDLLDVSTNLVKNMQRDFKRSIGDKITAECIEITVLNLTRTSTQAYRSPVVETKTTGSRKPEWSGDEPHSVCNAAFLSPWCTQQWAAGRGSRKARRCSTGLPTPFRSPTRLGSGSAVTNRNWSTTMAITLSVREQRTIHRALRILETSFKHPETTLGTPSETRDYLRLRFAGNVREEFHAIWLDAQLGVIAAETLFVGTLTETTVYPREVVRAAIRHNAGALILAHNHPSGKAAASVADITLTKQLQKALALIDVELLDHVIVTEKETRSLGIHLHATSLLETRLRSTTPPAPRAASVAGEGATKPRSKS